jgi:hypothetical protein
MSEGEFEKRILKMQSSMDTSLAPSYDKTLFRMHTAGILDVLDDARKEFPIHFIMEKPLYENPEYPDQMTGVEVVNFPNAKLPENRANAVLSRDVAIDWFLKWFGKL